MAATNIVQAALDEIEKAGTATPLAMTKADLLPAVIRAQWEDRRTAAIERLAAALASGIIFSRSVT